MATEARHNARIEEYHTGVIGGVALSMAERWPRDEVGRINPLAVAVLVFASWPCEVGPRPSLASVQRVCEGVAR